MSGVRILGNRELPHNEEAERNVVGGVLVYGKAFLEVADVVKPADFAHGALAAIFEAFIALSLEGKPLDHVTVYERMQTTGSDVRLRAFNGQAFFGELMSEVATVENIATYARIVAEKAAQRRAIEAAQEAHAIAYAGEDDWRTQYGASVFTALEQRQTNTTASLKDVLRERISDLERRWERKEVLTGTPSGFDRLDALTGGWQDNDLIIIAARPSMGKTSLALNAGIHAAVRHKVAVLVISVEMSKGSLADRVLCCEARIDASRLRTGFLDQRDWITITKVAPELAAAPVTLDDDGAPTLLDVRTKALRWRAKNPGRGLVVVDYLQLLSSPRRGREHNREREISEISRGLKALAKELHVPVIALSQLNRGCEARADKRPQLSDLRESGAIEQDADVIAFIYRDEVYDKESQDKGVAEVIIGKQRNGPIGTARLGFEAAYTRFTNLSGERAEAPAPKRARSGKGNGFHPYAPTEREED